MIDDDLERNAILADSVIRAGSLRVIVENNITGRDREMGFSVHKLTKSLIVATAVIVLLGMGTGAAMAATGDGSQHQLTRKQLCTRGQIKETLDVGKYVYIEYVLQGAEADTIGAFTIPDAVLTAGDTALVLWETHEDLKYCSGPVNKMPKPKLPAFLQHIKKNEYGGGDD